MILRPGDTQEILGVGVFEWDGIGFWVLEKIKHTHAEMYVILRDAGFSFNVKSAKKESG